MLAVLQMSSTGFLPEFTLVETGAGMTRFFVSFHLVSFGS